MATLVLDPLGAYSGEQTGVFDAGTNTIDLGILVPSDRLPDEDWTENLDLFIRAASPDQVTVGAFDTLTGALTVGSGISQAVTVHARRRHTITR